MQNNCMLCVRVCIASDVINSTLPSSLLFSLSQLKFVALIMLCHLKWTANYQSFIWVLPKLYLNHLMPQKNGFFLERLFTELLDFKILIYKTRSFRSSRAYIWYLVVQFKVLLSPKNYTENQHININIEWAIFMK